MPEASLGTWRDAEVRYVTWMRVPQTSSVWKQCAADRSPM
jgi:hypothetical protein